MNSDDTQARRWPKSSATPIDPSTERLIQRARRAARLSAAEELECIRAWQTQHDRRAAAVIVEANLRHVVFKALEFRNYGIPVADLISEGNVGLMTALARFDETKGVRFATYAVHWIRAHVVLAVMSSWSLVSGARGALSSRVFFRLRRERARLAALEGEGDMVTSLAERFGVSEPRMQEMLMQIDSRVVSLDHGASDTDEALELATDDDQERALASRQLEVRLERAIDRARPTLTARETFILDRRLMADPDDELSLGQIGSHFGVSRERVRQLEMRTRAKLLTRAMSDEDVRAA
jgi:RNA polymerase sigma-32 factor